MNKAFKTGIFLKLNINLFQDKSLKLFTDDNSDSEDEDKELSTDTIPDSTSIFVQSIKCAAHTLQLSVHDGIKILKTDVRICQVLNECKLIAKFVRKSTSVSYFLKGFVCSQFCVTRWSSDFCLIKHIININDNITKELQATNFDLIINQREIQILS